MRFPCTYAIPSNNIFIYVLICASVKDMSASLNTSHKPDGMYSNTITKSKPLGKASNNTTTCKQNCHNYDKCNIY